MGRGDNHNQYVTSFVLAVSDDGVKFKYITEDGSTSENEDDAKLFEGSKNKDDVVEIGLPLLIRTTVLRLYPKSYVGHYSLRWDILECYIGQLNLKSIFAEV